MTALVLGRCLSSVVRGTCPVVCFVVGGGIVLAQAVKDDAAPVKQPLAITAGFGSAAQEAIVKVTSSLEHFQQLLALTPEERVAALSQKSDRQRKFLHAEIEKYDSMPKAERETSLQGLRAWYYVRELVKFPKDARTGALAIIPETDRNFVEIRLRRWDLLDADLQQEVLANERTIRYVLQLEGLSPKEQDAKARVLPDSLRKTWDEKLKQWHNLPAERRQLVYGRFQKFFELSPRERAKVLETLSEKDRQEAEVSLKALEDLPAAERAACLNSFQKFVETPPQSQQHLDFLRTFEWWKEMSPKEKRVWKSVTTVLPPGMGPPIPSSVSGPPRGENKANPPALPGANPR